MRGVIDADEKNIFNLFPYLIDIYIPFASSIIIMMMTVTTSVASSPFGVACIRHLDLVLKIHRLVARGGVVCESSSGLHCIPRHNSWIPLPFRRRLFRGFGLDC
jgi:hypothetical protein